MLHSIFSPSLQSPSRILEDHFSDFLYFHTLQKVALHPLSCEEHFLCWLFLEQALKNIWFWVGASRKLWPHTHKEISTGPHGHWRSISVNRPRRAVFGIFLKIEAKFPFPTTSWANSAWFIQLNNIEVLPLASYFLHLSNSPKDKVSLPPYEGSQTTSSSPINTSFSHTFNWLKWFNSRTVLTIASVRIK